MIDSLHSLLHELLSNNDFLAAVLLTIIALPVLLFLLRTQLKNWRQEHNIRKVIEVSDYTYVLTLGEVTAEGLRKEFTGDMHDQVRGWLGLDF